MGKPINIILWAHCAKESVSSQIGFKLQSQSVEEKKPVRESIQSNRSASLHDFCGLDYYPIVDSSNGSDYETRYWQSRDCGSRDY
jgi:hypothetical protein